MYRYCMIILTGKYELENVTIPLLTLPTSSFTEQWTSADRHRHSTRGTSEGLVL